MLFIYFTMYLILKNLIEKRAEVCTSALLSLNPCSTQLFYSFAICPNFLNRNYALDIFDLNKNKEQVVF